MLNNIRDRFRNDNKKIFYIICIIFAVIFSFIGIFGDDATGMQGRGSIAACWQKSVDFYTIWSSRIFVNFVVFLFTRLDNTYYWGIFMGISLYVLMYSFSKLFASRENEKECNMVIASLVMLFPFYYLGSAGWLSTLTTYLSPTAFGFLSLIPLKKVYDGEKISWYGYIIYSLALLYGANNEQMMVVVVGCYIVGFIYLLLCRKFDLYILFQSLLAIASFCIVMLCPGNENRVYGEQGSYFKNWRMLNKIDKADLGYSTTMQDTFFGSHICIIAVCCLLTYLIWKKYKKTSYMMIAGIPAFLTILFGPLKDVVSTMFPNTYGLTDKIDRDGLVTAANRGDFKAFGRYFIWAAMITMICITVILLQDNIRMLVFNMVLLGAGTASRLAIGLSPTIYISGGRAFTAMFFCIIAVACCVYSNCINQGYIKAAECKKINTIGVFLLVCSMINILFLAAQ